MAWCIPITWGEPFVGNVVGVPYGGGITPNTVQNHTAGPGGTNADMVKDWNDESVPQGITFSVVEGPDGLCICAETNEGVEPPVGIKIVTDGVSQSDTFSEISKEDVVEPPTDEKKSFIEKCFEIIFGCTFSSMLAACLNKAGLATAIQSEYSEPGGPVAQTFNGEIIGWNQSTSGNWLYGDWGTPVGTIGATVNPAGTPGQQIGTLFVDPNLPPNPPLPAAPATSFDFTYTVEDSTGGMGTVGAVEKSTGLQIPGGGYPAAAGGPTQGPVPFDHTVSFTIPAGVDPSDICIVFNAFGVAPAAPSAWGADEINPSTESLIAVTPSQCAPAVACFEDIFGWSIDDMVTTPEPPEPFDPSTIVFPEVVHPSPAVERCSPNHLNPYAGFQGQINQITATNFADQILGWLPTNTFTAECDGVTTVNFDSPWVRTAARNAWVQVYVDVRLLRNGTPVLTRNSYTLLENNRQTLGGAINWEEHSFSVPFCVSAAAGDEFVVEHRYKARVIGATAPSYGRLLVYRETAVFLNTPTDLVKEVSHV